jgi:hypothetical protein
MAKDRAKDDRRSVGSHEKMMGALGRASGGWKKPYGPHYLSHDLGDKGYRVGPDFGGSIGLGHVKLREAGDKSGLYEEKGYKPKPSKNDSE